MDNNNLNECFFYLGINLSLFITKNLFSYFFSKNLKKNEENKKFYYNNNNNFSNEIENLKFQYKNLKDEIENYYNHQNYVKFTKLNRKIEKLKSEIEKKTLEQTNKNNKISTKNNFQYEINNNNFFNYIFLQKNSIFEILIWFITIFLYFFIKNKTLKIPYIEKFQENILIEFYHKEENFTIVEIPFRTILICETLILIQLNKLINFFI
jgi:hypothetical protein